MENKEKEMIQDDQLEAAAGGAKVVKATGRVFYGHVGMYDGQIGQKYYVVEDKKPDHWFYGTLEKSYEDSVIGDWITNRVHELSLSNGSSARVDGDNFSLYTCMDLKAD